MSVSLLFKRFREGPGGPLPRTAPAVNVTGGPGTRAIARALHCTVRAGGSRCAIDIVSNDFERSQWPFCRNLTRSTEDSWNDGPIPDDGASPGDREMIRWISHRGGGRI